MKALILRLSALVSVCIPLLAGSAPGAEINATFNSATTVPVTAAGYTATGNTVNLALTFAPAVGTELTVVKNTGMNLIGGVFDNLAQGQRVNLAFNGILYPFVATYHGGTGNDLVLEWGNTRLMAWGENGRGQLGTWSWAPNSLAPVPAALAGNLNGGTVAIATGSLHSMALGPDGSLFAWGTNVSEQLGIGLAVDQFKPVALSPTGGLLGKRVVAFDTGYSHSLALCDDGSLVAWGGASSGQMGRGTNSNNSYPNSPPVTVDMTGVLSGKKVLAIVTGDSHNLVLCEGGSVAAWGANNSGQVGNGSTSNQFSPVWVSTTGGLAGKTVAAIAAGAEYCLALNTDGSLAAWGYNWYGQLGDGTTTNRSTPVVVNRSGVLAGKTVTSIAAGSEHCLALCSDGTLAAWGKNYSGQLGDGTTTDRKTPVLVNRTGVLVGKTVIAISAGPSATLALCSDGSIAAWGDNSVGQLGNNTTVSSNVPVLVQSAALTANGVPTKISMSRHALALVAIAPPPVVETLAATGIGNTTAILNGSVNANGSATNIAFEYGPTSAYGSTITAVPATASGTTATPVTAAPAGLAFGTTYHYRIVGTGAGGTVSGADQTFTTTDSAALAGLVLGSGSLVPAFAPKWTSYAISVASDVSSTMVTATVGHAGATVKVNGGNVVSGSVSPAIPLTAGDTPVTVEVTGTDGLTQVYEVVVTRLPETLVLGSGTAAPVTVKGFSAGGRTAKLALNFAPPVGATLPVVNNTGTGPIQGEYSNLAQNQVVILAYQGANYPWLVNYRGGDGNDLVLEWASRRVVAWGSNTSGQLGDGSTTNSTLPLAVADGLLSGKAMTEVDARWGGSAALCADGTLAVWGGGTAGILGDGTTQDSRTPLNIAGLGVLAGKTVIGVATGYSHCMAWCADGTLVGWGDNSNGKIGTNNTVNATVPVRVDQSGVLAGKMIKSVACGSYHTLALCTDGTLAAWGANTEGQLGFMNSGSFSTDWLLPTLTGNSGLMADKTVTAIAAGNYFSMALCSDGTLAMWGNVSGDNVGGMYHPEYTTARPVNLSGVLAGKTITAISAIGNYGLVLCADGTLAELNSSLIPVLVNRSGVLAGKTVTSIASGWKTHCVVCSDGSLATWSAYAGSVGSPPTLVSGGALTSGERFMRAASGGEHALAITARPPAPTVQTLAATSVTDNSATLRGTVSANGATTTISIEYGLTASYGTKVAATPASASGTAATAASLLVTGLKPGTLYHYRILATSTNGNASGEDMTFTTTESATLAGLTLSVGTLAPRFVKTQFSYEAMVPFTVSSITVTPAATFSDATIRVNGTVVKHGAASEPINLAPGPNTITAVVTSADGVSTLAYTVTVARLPGTYVFNSAATVPVTTNEVVLGGENATISLNFAPLPGTRLTVLNSTGNKPIQGAFANLAQGQIVNLTFSGVIYPFVANYYGGTGNDLVLQWASTRLLAWGDNSSGQLGNNTTVASSVPVPVNLSGALAGRAILAVAAGRARSGVLCADGSVFQWGLNTAGNLAENAGAPSKVAVPVNQAGVLAGKRVVNLAMGYDHCLALCADGTLASWGNNSYQQLGNPGLNSASSSVPVLVDQTGVLAGKTVTAIAVGNFHNLALCTDGTLAIWGGNGNGQLGDGTTDASARPLLVNRSGVLAGKTVTAVAAAGPFSLVLCEDGTLAAWGSNSYGQLGNNSTIFSAAPVLVDRSGVLAGKTVTAIATGDSHCLALCADGTLASWGGNYSGQLGNGSSSGTISTPVLVTRTGVLAGKTITAIRAGQDHSAALCADGTVAIWGSSSNGQLGTGTTGSSSTVPVLVTSTMLTAGERFTGLSCGDLHTLALTALPPAPAATTLAATAITDTGATFNGQVNAQGAIATVTFEYGLTDAYGQAVAATPATVSGSTATAVSATPSGLQAGVTYHFRTVATSAGGTARGADMTFTTTSLSRLAGLELSAGMLWPAFSANTMNYLATVPYATGSLTVTPLAEIATTAVSVNGTTVVSGTPSQPLSLVVGNNPLTVVTSAADGINSLTYTVTVTRLPQSFAFASANTVPVTAAAFLSTGNSATFTLGYAPTPGTDLTAINNTGTNPIQGRFGNLAQGQAVAITYAGITYAFVADYFGGTGNDLVLRWANVRPFAWSSNSYGQVGNNSTTNSLVPVPVSRAGLLADKTVTAISIGDAFKVALCHDGTLAGWGVNDYDQAGYGSNQASSVPRSMMMEGVLAGKTLSAVSAGSTFTLGLCHDGTLAAWGENGTAGHLGNNSTSTPAVPVAVDRGGVLKDRRVVAITAGGDHSLALCENGTVAAWGTGGAGELGTGSPTGSLVPVKVFSDGVLAGKRVVALAAGGLGYASGGHSLALCSDGTVAAWGGNYYGQLGNNSTTNISVPVAVVATGALAGKSVAAIAAGSLHSLALCTDGTLVAWGYNSYGQLGNNSNTNSSVPVAVVRTGVLAGKTVTAIAARIYTSYALCSDGTCVTWGYNSSGELGNNSTTNQKVPVLVNTSNLAAGERFVKLANGPAALVASPPAPLATTLAASDLTAAGATLNGSVSANGSNTTISFEYGLTTAYGTTVAATPGTVTGATTKPTSATVSGLLADTTYHFRVLATNDGGIVKGDDQTFTTLSDNAWLAGLGLNAGTLVPGFDKLTMSYITTVPFNTDTVTVTPDTEHARATVKINGTTVASGSASGMMNLAVGNNPITVTVTAEDRITTKTYTITVTRLPQEFVFNSSSDIPLTANGFATGGYPATLTLNFAPPPGTVLTMVNNTALGFIHGRFGNLAQGQRVTLNFGGKGYDFVANYFGGTGNDLVLQWADTAVFGWGSNNHGQLGDASTTHRLSPVAADASGALAGKTVFAVSGGYLHSLALCSDGTLAAWGYNIFGQLGNNGSTSSSVPVAVDRSGVLVGRSVIAISAGPFHNLALCTDGTIVSWGYNNHGQLGTGDKVTQRVPALVKPVAALAGKQVVALAAGIYQSFALCSDGSVAAWGYNDEGELGDGSNTGSLVPVAVALSGKKVASFSAGQYHTLALCTDGTLLAWGYNQRGQLGNGLTVASNVPLAINSSGDLAGKTVSAVAAGGYHSLALCADGTLAAWGYNHRSQTGATGVTQSTTPVSLSLTGGLAGRTIAGIIPGSNHNLVRFTDGTLAAWGDNSNGQLGNHSTENSAMPVNVNMDTLTAGARPMFAASGASASHNLLVIGLPRTPESLRLTSHAGADEDDSDHDGLSNLIEYAFGLDPNENSAGQLPQPVLANGVLTIRFTQPSGVTGITYGAEWSRTMEPGTWQDAPNTGSGTEHRFAIPATGLPQAFIRLKVTRR